MFAAHAAFQTGTPLLWRGYFDGSGDYLTIPYSTTNFDWWATDFTIEAWVFSSSWSSWSYADYIGGNPILIGNNAYNSTSNYWSFGPLSNGKLGFYYFSGTANGMSSTASLNAGQWNHIAMTKTSSGITLFVNGVSSSTTAVSGTPQSGSSTGLTIGAGNNSYITGYVSNLRLVKSSVYSSTFTPSPEALGAISGTTLLTIQSSLLVDKSSNNLSITKYGDVTMSSFGSFT